MCVWYRRQELNLHGCPLDPKSSASANFATPACIIQLYTKLVRLSIIYESYNAIIGELPKKIVRFLNKIHK